MDLPLGDCGLWFGTGALPESDEALGERTLFVVVEADVPGRSLTSFRSLFLGLGLPAGASRAGDICDTSGGPVG